MMPFLLSFSAVPIPIEQVEVVVGLSLLNLSDSLPLSRDICPGLPLFYLSQFTLL
jgi:hypothetical protein